MTAAHCPRKYLLGIRNPPSTYLVKYGNILLWANEKNDTLGGQGGGVVHEIVTRHFFLFKLLFLWFLKKHFLFDDKE